MLCVGKEEWMLLPGAGCRSVLLIAVGMVGEQDWAPVAPTPSSQEICSLELNGTQKGELKAKGGGGNKNTCLGQGEKCPCM